MEKAGGWPGGPVPRSDGPCVSSKDSIFHSQLQAFCGGEHIFDYLFYFQIVQPETEMLSAINK